MPPKKKHDGWLLTSPHYIFTNLSIATVFKHIFQLYWHLVLSLFPGILRSMLTPGICTTDQDYLPPEHHSTDSWNLLALIPHSFLGNHDPTGLKNLHLTLIFLMLQFVQFDHPRLVKRLRWSSDMWRTNHGDFSRKRLELPFEFQKRSKKSIGIFSLVISFIFCLKDMFVLHSHVAKWQFHVFLKYNRQKTNKFQRTPFPNFSQDWVSNATHVFVFRWQACQLEPCSAIWVGFPARHVSMESW